MSHIHQITLRGLGPELSRQIRELAKKEGISLNKAALRLMRGSVEQPDAQTGKIGESLDHLIGSWTERQSVEFMNSIASLDQIDQELWS